MMNISTVILKYEVTLRRGAYVLQSIKVEYIWTPYVMELLLALHLLIVDFLVKQNSHVSFYLT